MTGHKEIRFIDTASWITLRWIRGTPYYRVHLEQDLCSEWLLTKFNGRSKRGYELMSWNRSEGRISMEPLQDALRMIKRKTELEAAMRRPGGIRVTEERELFQLRGALAQFPAAVSAIMEAAARMRRPVDTISAEDVEKVAHSTSH
ncbi:MAG: hypothetical protein ACLP0B_25990 [Steroidobacteraceae bacterium]